MVCPTGTIDKIRRYTEGISPGAAGRTQNVVDKC